MLTVLWCTDLWTQKVRKWAANYRSTSHLEASGSINHTLYHRNINVYIISVPSMKICLYSMTGSISFKYYEVQ